MDIHKVFVIGSGAMGNGIAQVCAQKGISVVMCDLTRDVLDRAVERINWSVSNALYAMIPSLRRVYQIFCMAGILAGTASNYLLSKHLVFGRCSNHVTEGESKE